MLFYTIRVRQIRAFCEPQPFPGLCGRNALVILRVRILLLIMRRMILDLTSILHTLRSNRAPPTICRPLCLLSIFIPDEQLSFLAKASRFSKRHLDNIERSSDAMDVVEDFVHLLE